MPIMLSSLIRNASKNENTPLLSNEKHNNADIMFLMFIALCVMSGLLLGCLIGLLADRGNEKSGSIGLGIGAGVGAGAGVLGVAGALIFNRLRLFYNHKKLINSNQHITADLNPVSANNL